MKNAVQVGTRRGFRAFYNTIRFNLDSGKMSAVFHHVALTPVILACIATRLANLQKPRPGVDALLREVAPEHLIQSVAVRPALQPLTIVIQGLCVKHGLKRTERIIDLRVV